MAELLAFLLYVLLTILVIGVILWGVAHLPYIDTNMKELFRVVIIVATVLWLLYLLFGLITGSIPFVAFPLLKRYR